jgi:ribonuclease P protein component
LDVAGAFRSVRHGDHAVPETLPRPLLGAEHPLDVRCWRNVQGISPFPERPRLLVGISRKMGGAVLRNRFKRRVRMAALQVFRESGRQEMEPFTLFVRMGRNVPKGQELTYSDILRLLRMALDRASRRGS